MYYHRYLSLFVLEEFPGVVRDTARNLRVLDLCGKFAVDEQDRLVLEQYRPYIMMMNTRARASIEHEQGNYRQAVQIIRRRAAGHQGVLPQVRAGRGVQAVERSEGPEALRPRDPNKLPVDPVRRLQRQLAGREGRATTRKRPACATRSSG